MIVKGSRVKINHPYWKDWQGIVAERVENPIPRSGVQHFHFLVNVLGVHVHFFQHELELISQASTGVKS